MPIIHRADITPQRWLNTTGFPPDGREHFRELRAYGNRHAIFAPGSEWGIVHSDEHNATDFPFGTFNHLTHYVSERTGIPVGLVKLGMLGASLYFGSRFLKLR